MSTIETIALKLMITLACTISFAVHADDDDRRGNNYGLCKEDKADEVAARRKYTANKTPANKEAWDEAKTQVNDCVSNLRHSGNNRTGETCRDAKAEFNKAKGKYSGACRNAGLDPDNPKEEGKEGSIGCSWAQNRCQCLNKPSAEMSAKYRCQEAGKGNGSDRLSATTQSIGMIDLRAARKRLEVCPHEDPDDTERYEKQLEKAQERMKDAKKKMADLANKGPEAQDKATKEQNEIRKKNADLQKEFAKELADIKKKKTQDEQQAVAEMAGMRAEMDKLDAHRRTLELQKIDAEVKLGETKIQLELQCHAMASQQVAARQAAKMARISKGEPMGDFNSLMKKVGVSSRDAWKDIANVLYKRCIHDRPTLDQKKSAQKVYESTTRAIDAQIQATHQQRQRLNESINQIFSANGCGAPAPPVQGGPPAESKLCAGIREANEAMVQAQGNALVQQQMNHQEAIASQQSMMTKNQAMAREYGDAQQEFNDEQRRIDNLRAYLNLKREKSNGVGGKEASKALGETYGALVTAAENIVQCFADQPPRRNTPISPELNEMAARFLNSIGQLTVDDMEKFITPPIGKPDPTPAQSGTPPAAGDTGNGVSERGNTQGH